MAANGTASIIPMIPPNDHHASITIKTRKGDNSRDLLIIIGTSTLFSICWMRIYSISIIKPIFHDIQSPITSAGRSAINGPIYGINSISPAIRANVKTRSVSKLNIH